MRWLVFGSYDVRRHPRVGVLVQGLRDAGDDVVEVNVPLRVDTAGRVATLRQPWRLPAFVGQLARCWLLLALRAWRLRRALGRGRRGGVDAVLVGYLGHFDVRLARLLFRGLPIALDHLVSAAGTARDRNLAGVGGPRARLLRAIDTGALRRADLVVVDTTARLAELPPPARERAVVVPVGAGAEWFAAGAGRPRWPGWPDRPLRVVFVGLFTPLHGTATLGAALAGLADDERIEVSMVGTGQDHRVCRRAAAGNHRITWYDWVPAGELPGFVAAHDVALGIFGTTDKAYRVVPTKVFQGAAAGCAVVTSDTEVQRQALGDAAVFVPAGDAVALAAALRALADAPERVARLGAAARRRAEQCFRPVAVVAPLRQRLGAGRASAATGPGTPATTGPGVRAAGPPGTSR